MIGNLLVFMTLTMEVGCRVYDNMSSCVTIMVLSGGPMTQVNVSDADPCHSYAASFTDNFRTFWVNCSFHIKQENDCYNISSICFLDFSFTSLTGIKKL